MTTARAGQSTFDADEGWSADTGPFEAGPYGWLREARPFRVATRRPGRAVIFVALIAWAPLLVLAALQGRALAATPHQSLLLDLEAAVRYLIAAPLFLGAGSVYLPQLAASARALVTAGLIAEHERAGYEALGRSTRRLLTSRLTDAAIIGLAYVVTLTASPALSSALPTWAVGGDGHLLWAGWWRVLVSQPLFIALWSVWLWRLLLWIRFLWVVARMDLHLVAGHPDRLGGLGFMLVPLRGFAILAFALGTVAAGTIAEDVLVNGRTPADFTLFIGAQVVLVLLAFCAPLLLLSPPLQRLRDRGIVGYGRLASRVGEAFEARWLENARDNDAVTGLTCPDFSAVTDLFSIVANTTAINTLVLEPRDVIRLAAATLLPYVPVALAVMPLDRLLELTMQALL